MTTDTDPRARFDELLAGLQTTVDDLAMIDSPDFVPILQPADWKGRRRTDCARLLPNVPGSLLVALGRDLPEACVYLPRQKDREHRIDRKKAMRQARRHLRARPDRAPWQLIDLPEAGVRLLAREGDMLTASDILDKRVLRQAADELDSEVIYVGIPSRDQMVVAADPWSLLSFVPEQYERAAENGTALSPEVFVVTDGALTGTVAPQEEDDDTPSAPRRRTRKGRRRAGQKNGLSTLEKIGLVARTIKIVLVLIAIVAALFGVAL